MYSSLIHFSTFATYTIPKNIIIKDVYISVYPSDPGLTSFPTSMTCIPDLYDLIPQPCDLSHSTHVCIRCINNDFLLVLVYFKDLYVYIVTAVRTRFFFQRMPNMAHISTYHPCWHVSTALHRLHCLSHAKCSCHLLPKRIAQVRFSVSLRSDISFSTKISYSVLSWY